MPGSDYMKRKEIAVMFDSRNCARILVNPTAEIKALPGIILNPDLHAVINLPPENWKKVGSAIVPMTDQEIAIRNKELDSCPKHGVNIVEKVVEKIEKKVPSWVWALIALESAAVVALLFNR